MPTGDLRALPAASIARTRCDGCGRDIVWAVTVAGPNGPGGKLLPLDPLEDPAGSYAITAPSPGRGRLLARALMKDEAVDARLEYAGMPHFATCPTHTKPELPAGVIDMQQQRDRRRRRATRTGAPR